MKIKSGNVPKDEPIASQSYINMSKSVEKVEEEIEGLNASYSDTSLDARGLSSLPPGMNKVQRRRQYIKGQGWTLVVIHPKHKVDEIREFIGEIQDKQEHTLHVSRNKNGKSSSPPCKILQWIPKRQSFQAQVKEKLRMKKHKVRKPK